LSSNYNTILKIHIDNNHQTWICASGGVVKLIEGKGFKKSQTITPSSVNGDLNFTAIYRAKNKLFVGTLNDGLFKARILLT
jgi:ligand-binding sensor domain-containing protein